MPAIVYQPNYCETRCRVNRVFYIRTIVCPSRLDGLWSTNRRVEPLYFDGCPTYRVAEKTLRGVLAQKDVEAEVELVAVNTNEEAQRGSGSPAARRLG